MNLNEVKNILKNNEFEKVIELTSDIDQKDKNYIEALFIRGCAHRATGNITLAARDWGDALTKDENNLTILKSLAQLEYQTRKYNIATNLFNEVVEKDPADKDSWYLLSECLLIQKATEEGFKALNNFINLSLAGEESLNKACRLLLNRGYSKEVIALSNKAKKRFSTSTNFSIYEAKAWIKLSHYENGRDCLANDKSAQTTIEGLLCLAICYLRLKDAKKCEQYIRIVLQKEPDNQTANILLGQTCYSCGDLQTAITAWKRALYGRAEKPHPEALFWIAKYYFETTHEIRKAAETIELEINITNGKREESHYILIASLLGIGNYSDAQKAFLKAKKYFPRSIQIESLKTYFNESSSCRRD